MKIQRNQRNYSDVLLFLVANCKFEQRVCGHYTKAFQGSNWVALKPIVMEF